MTFLLHNRSVELESKDELASVSAIWSVKEPTKAAAVQIVLYVSRIEVIEQIENSQPYFEFALLAAKRQSQFFEGLNVE